MKFYNIFYNKYLYLIINNIIIIIRVLNEILLKFLNKIILFKFLFHKLCFNRLYLQAFDFGTLY